MVSKSLLDSFLRQNVGKMMIPTDQLYLKSPFVYNNSNNIGNSENWLSVDTF